MSNLNAFDPPANWDDFPPGHRRDFLRRLWSYMIETATETLITGLPDPESLSDNRYYNPLTTDISEPVAQKVIRWTAFPNRIHANFPTASQAQRFRYADEGPPGWSPDGTGSYEHRGPRGYQDEYCEWSVTRNDAGQITRVDFSCETPEYWEMLWLVDPDYVVAEYRRLLGKHVTKQDLVKPGTNSYDRTNKFNRDTSNGVVHLVSEQSTILAEMHLGVASTIIRQCNGEIVTNKDQLLPCSGPALPNRNSDPTIASEINKIIRGGGVEVSLYNPVGLYIQTPDFSSFQLPANARSGAKPSDYWKVVRGHSRSDSSGYDQILRATFEVPADEGFTVSDISIDDNQIQYGSQIANTFEVALVGLAIKSARPDQQPRPCVGDRAGSSEGAGRPVLLGHRALVVKKSDCPRCTSTAGGHQS